MTSPRATRPAAPPPPEPRLPPLTRLQLLSGMEVLVVERRELPVVDVRVVVRAGAAADPPDRAGGACLTTSLLDQGTAARSATMIAEQAELLGASLETRATWDACTGALHVLTSRFEPALELLADVLMRPSFPEEELERRRRNRLAAILQERAEPRIVASQAFARTLYGPDHPYGSPVGGTAESVAAITREDILAFYSRWFRPDRTCIVVVGDVTGAAVLPLLEQHFGAWTGAGPGRNGPASTEPPSPPQTGPSSIDVIHRPGAPQSELRVGRPGPHRTSPDYFPLLVANTVLGGAFTSRLNLLLRQEKAYTYGAGSSFAFRRAGGPFLASTAVSTAATADAVNDIVQQIARMSAEPVPEPELERARNYIMLGLPRTFETTGDIAEHASDVALYGLSLDYYDRYATRVRSVDAHATHGAAARWLHADDLGIVVVGDADAVATELEQLGIGTVNVRDES